MKKALILGCSHAVGAEMSQEPGLAFDNKNQATDYERKNCYPAQIAQALGYDPVNRGIAGGSNDAIFRLFLEETLTRDDIVIACWTGVNRSEIYDESWLQLCPGASIPKEITPDYFKQWLLYSGNTEVGMLNKTKNILALNAVCWSRGIQVINIDSFWPIDFFPEIDFTWPNSVYWPVDTDFMAWCQQHNFAHTEKVHFFKPAHDSYAEHVLQNIAGRAVTTPVS
jgi:hypothetical protein